MTRGANVILLLIVVSMLTATGTLRAAQSQSSAFDELKQLLEAAPSRQVGQPGNEVVDQQIEQVFATAVEQQNDPARWETAQQLVAEADDAEALLAQKAGGVTRKLVGFEMVERGIARHGYPVFVGVDRVGVVTSGTRTPFLEKAIGLAYLPVAACAPGTECAIEIRGRRTTARVVSLPFYKRG